MPIVRRYLTITQGNIDNSHIYLSEVMDMFPDDALGGPDESQSAPRTVRIAWGSEVVDTDVVRDKQIFRRRGWVKQFFSANQICAGDRILLEQIDPYSYCVSRAEN